ncbi:MAG: DMT family transporter [Sulfitobacter sp.]
MTLKTSPQMQKTISARAWGELALLALIWGTTFLSTRMALDEIGPLWVVAHRVFWAALVLWAIVLLRRLPLPRGWQIWAGFAVMGLLNNILPFTLMAWGQLHITSGLTSILNAATAIFGMLTAAIFFTDERLSARKLFGAALGFLGVATAIGLENLLRFDLRSLAQLAVIAGTISYALASVWGRKRLCGLHPLVASAGMLGGAALGMLPIAWLFEGPLDTSLAPRTIGALGFMTVIATAFAYLLYYRVLAMAGSGNLMLVTLLIPPVAIAMGAAVLGESLRASAFGGFALLAAGLLVIDGRVLRALAPAKSGS